MYPAVVKVTLIINSWLCAFTRLVCALGLGLGAQSSLAAEWSSANIQILRGSTYELGDSNQTVLTFEYADGWKYGDNFFFIDIFEPTSTGTSHYGEYSPRLSLGKISGKNLGFGIVTDILLAGTLEMGDGVRSSLLGIGIDLKLPGFAFAQFNLYARSSERDFVAVQTDSGAQATIAWRLPFKVIGQNLAFEGFADYAYGEDGGSSPKEDNLITAPRLLIDVGNWFGTPGKVEAGVEYQIWRNKFGINNIDENVAQAMVKWIF